MSVIDEIAAERRRQIAVEGWDAAHDDAEHDSGQLAAAAACYAAGSKLEQPMPAANVAAWERGSRMVWPWSAEWWKPKGGRRRMLVKAGALIVAEIERLDRAAANS